MKVQLELASDEQVLMTVDTVVKDFLTSNRWNEEDAYWFMFAVREVVVNAIVHGNNRNPGKKVFLTLEAENLTVRATILDQGDGDDVPSIPDIHHKENLLKSNGRGLFLARQVVDRLSLNRTQDGGLAVVLSKKAREGGKHENTG